MRLLSSTTFISCHEKVLYPNTQRQDSSCLLKPISTVMRQSLCSGTQASGLLVQCSLHQWLLCTVKSYLRSVVCKDVDGARVCYTECSQTERGKQILYITAYAWNLEKWYRLMYLQGRNRDGDIQNEQVDMVGRGVEFIGRLALTYIYTTMCKIDS